MIVYNVSRAWFTMKNDAEAHRKRLGLPPATTATIRIDSREELAGLLNSLMGLGEIEVAEAKTMVAGPALVPPEVVKRNQITNTPPDCVPAFLVREWEQKMKGVYK
ncbi:hypothetical protein NKH91_29620 [Mesorhizobium sp. M0894]|uniref:hypothetical protein n=1 Tax=unclassified Mesorhizobium TaxID=325217 RepID=UPI0033374E5B